MVAQLFRRYSLFSFLQTTEQEHMPDNRARHAPRVQCFGRPKLSTVQAAELEPLWGLRT